MKKSIALLVALILITSFAQIAQARYSYTDTISASLSFDGGKAFCSGRVVPSGNYDSSITVTLYEQSGSNWSHITSWEGSGTNGGAASAGGSISVGSGTYKVISSGNVADKEYPTKSVTRTKN